MDATAELGRNPVSKHHIQPGYGDESRLTRDGTAGPASRDQILRHERGQRNIHFPCSADHVQDWQPYPVDPYSCYMWDYTYIHTYIHSSINSSHTSLEMLDQNHPEIRCLCLQYNPKRSESATDSKTTCSSGSRLKKKKKYTLLY